MFNYVFFKCFMVILRRFPIAVEIFSFLLRLEIKWYPICSCSSLRSVFATKPHGKVSKTLGSRFNGKTPQNLLRAIESDLSALTIWLVSISTDVIVDNLSARIDFQNINSKQGLRLLATGQRTEAKVTSSLSGLG